MSKYDIFDFRLGNRPSGKKVVNMYIKLPSYPESNKEDRVFILGFLTKENIDSINELYGDL